MYRSNDRHGRKAQPNCDESASSEPRPPSPPPGPDTAPTRADTPTPTAGAVLPPPESPTDLPVMTLACPPTPDPTSTQTPDSVPVPPLGTPPARWQRTVRNYEIILGRIGQEWLEVEPIPDSVVHWKLKDIVLIALIIQKLRSVRDTAAYEAALQAISNRYRYTGYYPSGCKGSCQTKWQQMRWSVEYEMFYGWPVDEILRGWLDNLPDAQKVMGYTFAPGPRKPWTWGLYNRDSPLYEYVKERAQGKEPTADWWPSGRPYVEVVPEQQFLVLTLEQNVACNARRGGSCKGW